MKCFILDDSVIPHGRSKKVELLSFVQDHVIHKAARGFNLLLLGWTDGYRFLPVAFNMLASAKAGGLSCLCKCCHRQTDEWRKGV